MTSNASPLSPASSPALPAKRPLRISFILSSLWLSGGVLLVIECANHLAKRSHQVTLVVPGGTVDPSLAALLQPGVTLLESAVPLTEKRAVWSLLRLTLALAKITPQSDVLIATHTPTVAPTLLAARLLRKGRCTWLYMDYPRMFEKRPLERFLLRFVPRWFRTIMVISAPLAEYVGQQTRATVVNVRSGLSRAELFWDHPRLPKEISERRVLYVGDDRPRKGLREFLQAAEIIFPYNPDLKLVIASKMPCTVAITVPHEFYLHPSDVQLSELYRSSDLFVSASWGEGLGYPPLEAMACATPVVLTDSAGVRDYARHEQNCLMVPPRDVHALAEAITRLLHDPALAKHLVENGQVTARQYNWETMTDRVEDALGQLLSA